MTAPLAVATVLLLAGASLGVSAALRAVGLTPPLTRWVASLAGSAAYFPAVMWLDPWTATALSFFALLVVSGLRLRRSTLLAGLRWSSAERSRAELGYPAAATAALVFCWGFCGDRWLAYFAIACMAWGDASAGLVRGLTARPGSPLLSFLSASGAMLAACITVAALVYPSERAFAAAIAATLAEAIWPVTRCRVSDSWPVVGTAVVVVQSLGGR